MANARINKNYSREMTLPSKIFSSLAPFQNGSLINPFFLAKSFSVPECTEAITTQETRHFFFNATLWLVRFAPPWFASAHWRESKIDVRFVEATVLWYLIFLNIVLPCFNKRFFWDFFIDKGSLFWMSSWLIQNARWTVTVSLNLSVFCFVFAQHL